MIFYSRTKKFERLYFKNKIARKVVDLIPNLMAKAWGEAVSIDLKNTKHLAIIEEISPHLEKLRNIYCQGQKHANLYGGAVVVRLVDDAQNWDLPVDLTSIRHTRYSRILDIWEIQPNPLNIVDYGKLECDYHNPDLYQILLSSRQIKNIYKDRVLRFRGEFLPTELLRNNNYWEASVLESFAPKLDNYEKTIINIVDTIDSYSTPTITKKGFITQLGKNLQETVDNIKLKATDILNRLGIKKGLMMDSEMEFKFHERKLTGLDNLVSVILNDLVANTSLTRPQLLNEHPVGMQSTGKSEKLTEADTIESLQEQLWGENIRYDLELLLAPYKLKPNSIKWRWVNSYKPSPLEEVEIKLKQLELEKEAKNVK